MYAGVKECFIYNAVRIGLVTTEGGNKAEPVDASTLLHNMKMKAKTKFAELFSFHWESTQVRADLEAWIQDYVKNKKSNETENTCLSKSPSDIASLRSL